MNQLVLSGTATLVLSGTRSSCYRGPESGLRACFSALSSRSNFTNQKSFGFLLTERAESRGCRFARIRDLDPRTGEAMYRFPRSTYQVTLLLDVCRYRCRHDTAGRQRPAQLRETSVQLRNGNDFLDEPKFVRSMRDLPSGVFGSVVHRATSTEASATVPSLSTSASNLARHVIGGNAFALGKLNLRAEIAVSSQSAGPRQMTRKPVLHRPKPHGSSLRRQGTVA
ncbi:hypothetical protein ACVIIW_000023 [Bradyrhizobium sp. USDA 4449]